MPALPGSVLITGSNRGIGLCLLKHFAAANKNSDSKCKIIACSRSMSEELESLVKHDPNVHHVPLEVSNEQSVSSAVKSVDTLVGEAGLNLLINNAGVMSYPKAGSAFVASNDNLRQVLETNVVGVQTVTAGFRSLLLKAAEHRSDHPVSCVRAGIVNVSSNLGSIAGVNSQNAAYAFGYRVSKSAVNMLTRCHGLELVDHGVLCFCLHPGWVQTDMGGPQGSLTVEESVSDIIGLINSVTAEHAGAFLGAGMEVLPY